MDMNYDDCRAQLIELLGEAMLAEAEEMYYEKLMREEYYEMMMWEEYYESMEKSGV